MKKKTKDKIMNFIKKSFIGLFILYVIAVVLTWYTIGIPIGFNELFIWYFILFVGILFVGILIYNSIFYHDNSQKISFFKFRKYNKVSTTVSVFGIQVVIVSTIVLLASNLIAGPVFNANKYKNATSYKDVNVSKVIKRNETKFPIVDSKYAVKLGDKVLGNQKLGTYFQVGEYEDIMYNGKFVSVAPLEYNDFFKWFKKKTTPGYIIVDKYTGEVELVSNRKLKYLPSAYLNNNLNRHIALNNVYQTYEARFELDDKGNPYWITNNYQPTSFLKLPLVTSVVTINAETGKVNKYKIGEQPSWIDNVYSPNYQRDLINMNLKYVHGWFNSLSFTSQEGVTSLSDGSAKNPNTDKNIPDLSYRYMEIDGEIYMYSGVTSVGKDESLIGFMLTDIKTGKNNFVKSGAISEVAAMESLMGELQNYKYTATFPVLVKVDEKLVYFMSLKDSSGLIKGYGFVDVNDMSKLSFGKTVNEAYFNYTKKDINTNDTVDNTTKKTKLTIKRINYNQSDSTYYILASNNKIYTVLPNVSSEIVNTRDKDKIEVLFDKDNKIYFFNNLEY